MRNKILIFIGLGLMTISLGCAQTSGNDGRLQSYSVPLNEPDWVRNGEPVIFEKHPWYPQDGIEVFTDSEVILLGEYRGTQYFVERVDVRPYDRIYTKFGRNKFRYYEKEQKK